jgi:hypothetical protein
LVEPGGEVLDHGEVEEGNHEGFELFSGKLVDLNGDSGADIAEFLIEQYGNERSTIIALLRSLFFDPARTSRSLPESANRLTPKPDRLPAPTVENFCRPTSTSSTKSSNTHIQSTHKRIADSVN